MTLQARLLALVAGLLGLSLLLSLAIVYHDMSGQITRTARQSLEVAGASFQTRQANERQLLEIAASTLETEPGFRNVLRTNDKPTIEDYLGEMLEALRIDLVVVRDAQDRVQAAVPPIASPPKMEGEDYWLLDSGLYHITSLPMADSGDRVTGSLSVGVRVDDKTVRALGRDTGCQVVLWSGQRVLAATLPVNAVPEGGLTLNGVHYQTAVRRLGQAASLGLLRDTKDAEDRLVYLSLWLCLVGSGALLLALVVSAPLLGRIANPVERVLKAEARLAAVFEANTDGLVALDSEGRVTMANPAAARALGLEPEALQGRSLEQILPEDVAEQLLSDPEGRLVQRARLERAGHRFLLARSFLGRQSPGSLLALRDVTSEEESEARLEAFFRAFSSAEEARLRANLAVLAEGFALELGPVEVPGLPSERVLANSGALRLVLDNLLDNANRYGTAVESGARREGGAVEIWVSDRGPGFSPTARQQILSRHYPKQQLHAAGGASGPGLGLYVSARLVESMGGRLSYEDLEPGSRFSFWLPVAVA